MNNLKSINSRNQIQCMTDIDTIQAAEGMYTTFQQLTTLQGITFPNRLSLFIRSRSKDVQRIWFLALILILMAKDSLSLQRMKSSSMKRFSISISKSFLTKENKICSNSQLISLSNADLILYIN